MLKENLLDNILLYLASFASGAILGAAYFDLIPEAVELIEVESAIPFIALGFVLFYLLRGLSTGITVMDTWMASV